MKPRRQFIVTILLLCLLTIPSLLYADISPPFCAASKTLDQIVKEAKTTIKELTPGDVKKMLDTKENLILLDVRDQHEFADGFIPGAINISRGSLEFRVSMIIPDKSTKIVVYCGLDLRSPLAVKTLNELGYINAVNMIGGLKEWKNIGYPVSYPNKP